MIETPRMREDTGDALAAFEAERRALFGIAYRMLGSVHEAEDALQEACIRWLAADRAAVERPAAYLVRLVTRLCIDQLRSAHARRVEYVGPWLPEPLVENAMDRLTHDPAEHQALADDLSQAFLVLLERLNPLERAVFLLHQSFGYSYRDIAGVVGKTEENCRQIERRARARLEHGGRLRPVDPAAHETLLARFLGATREGDVDGLLALLSDDVVSYSDGGGKVFAARRPVAGAAMVARFLTGLVAKAPPGLHFRIAPVNGQPGILTFVGDALRNVITVHVEDGRIRRIFIVVNPDKLPELTG
jgi:RNA polymerase sigma-70 factor (ECF subfamily)